MKRLIALLVVLFFAAGCATPGQQARTEGTVGGALIGAGLGAATGALFGGGKGALIGGLTGALAGGAVGYSYSDKIAKRNEELVGRENDLDAQIKFARGVNQDTQEYNQSLEREVNASKAKVDVLLAKKGQQRITQAELNREKQQLTTKTDDANAQIALAGKELQRLQSFRSQGQQPSGALDAEIKQLEASLQQLRTNTSALAAQNQRI